VIIVDDIRAAVKPPASIFLDGGYSGDGVAWARLRDQQGSHDGLFGCAARLFALGSGEKLDSKEQ